MEDAQGNLLIQIKQASVPAQIAETEAFIIT